MVNQTLEEAYEKLRNKKRNYGKASRFSNALVILGLFVFYFSLIPVIPLILQYFLKVNGVYSLIGGIIMGVIMMSIGVRFRKKISPCLHRLSQNEIEFFKVFEALKELELYLKNHDNESELSKFEATKLLSKVERGISSKASLRKSLMKEIYEKLTGLRLNLNERLIPTIRNGEIEEVRKTYSVIEELAQYLLKPSLSKLDSLNILMSELPSSYIEKKEPIVSLLKQSPYFQHVIVFSSLILMSYFVFYLGINYVTISHDNAYIAATAFFGTLSAGYLATLKRGQ